MTPIGTLRWTDKPKIELTESVRSLKFEFTDLSQFLRLKKVFLAKLRRKKTLMSLSFRPVASVRSKAIQTDSRS